MADKQLKDATDFTGLRHKWATVTVDDPTYALTAAQTGKRFIFTDENPLIVLPLDPVIDETTYRIIFLGSNTACGSIDAGTDRRIIGAYAENAGFQIAAGQSLSGIYCGLEYEISYVGTVSAENSWISNIIVVD